MVVPLAGVLGLVVGSFLTVVTRRIPLRRSVVRPGSHCPGCGAPLRVRDNVPLLSYVLLRGCCRDCGGRIPARYPLAEATTGGLFAAAAYEFDPGPRLLAAVVLLAALIALAAIDVEHRLLPNVIVIPAALGGLALSTLANPESWWAYPLSAAAVGGGLLSLAAVYPGGMGMGDVKMAAMLGAFLGPCAALAVFLGAFLGAIVGGMLLVFGKVGRQYPMPFGTFMAVGGVFALFFGPDPWGGQGVGY